MPSQRLRDLALLLPLALLVLLLPPFLRLFSQWGGNGVPELVLYLFAVWAIAIILGGQLAHRLAEGRETPRTSRPRAEPDS